MKIVFMGNPDFAVASLKALVDDGAHIAAAVTMPDRVGGRGNKPIVSPVKAFAASRGIPVLQPEKLRDPDFLSRLRALRADLFIVIAFRMLPREVWEMPPLGTFNLHASLLPRYRGAAPIQWAVINGDTSTGVTTFMLRHELDTGDVIDRRSIPVGPDDNVGDVHDRLMDLGATLVVDTVRRIAAGNLRTTPQAQLGGEPTPAPKIFKETCRIDWNRPSQTVHNLVRGLSPHPGAWSVLRPEGAKPAEVKILATRLIEAPAGAADAEPGQIIVDGARLCVKCGAQSVIEITSLQSAGHRRMDAAEWLRGARWTRARFENAPAGQTKN